MSKQQIMADEAEARGSACWVVKKTEKPSPELTVKAMRAALNEAWLVAPNVGAGHDIEELFKHLKDTTLAGTHTELDSLVEMRRLDLGQNPEPAEEEALKLYSGAVNEVKQAINRAMGISQETVLAR
jgi:hypothetical protein